MIYVCEVLYHPILLRHSSTGICSPNTPLITGRCPVLFHNLNCSWVIMIKLFVNTNPKAENGWDLQNHGVCFVVINGQSDREVTQLIYWITNCLITNESFWPKISTKNSLQHGKCIITVIPLSFLYRKLHRVKSACDLTKLKRIVFFIRYRIGVV